MIALKLFSPLDYIFRLPPYTVVELRISTPGTDESVREEGPGRTTWTFLSGLIRRSIKERSI